MRRKDRQMPTSFAYEVAYKCEFAVISMIDTEKMPYCLPISIARDKDNIYFHCAKEGFKVDSLNLNNNVCITCVGKTNRPPDEFTTEYESAIIRGQAFEILDYDEKIRALWLLCIRHTPANMDNFDIAIAKSLDRTAVWKVAIQDISGKRKKYDKNKKEMKFGRTE